MIIDTSMFYIELENAVAICLTAVAGIVLVYGITFKKGTKK